MKQSASLIVGALAALLALPAGGTELNDPTRPVDVKPTSVGSVAPAAAGDTPPARLEAVLHAPDRTVAIINGKLLHVGDWVGDARIEAIDLDSVRLVRAGRSSLTLRLARQTMKVRGKAGTEDPQ